jgi:hypothetical protein
MAIPHEQPSENVKPIVGGVIPPKNRPDDGTILVPTDWKDMGTGALPPKGHPIDGKITGNETIRVPTKWKKVGTGALDPKDIPREKTK